MNEKIVLKNNKEYPLVIGGTSSTPSTLRLIFQASEPLEDIVAVFEDQEATGQIKTINEDGSTLAVYDGYTVLENPKAIDDHYLITPEQYDADGAVTVEAVYGHVALLTLSQPGVDAKVDQNRADIDFLAIMTGTDLYGGIETMNAKALAQKYYPRLWDIDRLKALVAAGKLTEADYKEITRETYTKGV